MRGSFSRYLSSKGYYKLSLQADHKAYSMGSSPAYSRRYLSGLEYLHALLMYLHVLLISRSGGFYLNLTGGYEHIYHIYVEGLPAGLRHEGVNKFVYGSAWGWNQNCL